MGATLLAASLGCSAAPPRLAPVPTTPSPLRSPAPDEETAQQRQLRLALFEEASHHSQRAHGYPGSDRPAYDGQRLDASLETSLAEYVAAVAAWQKCVAASRRASDIHEARYSLAVALLGVARNTLELGRPLREEDIVKAEREATAVRDGAGDETFVEPAAALVVDLALLRRDDALRQYRETGHTGLVERAAPRFEQLPHGNRVPRDPIPPVIERLNSARQAYIHRVPPRLDTNARIPSFRIAIAESLFSYGHLDEARIRYEEIRRLHAGSMLECMAWDRLISIRHLTGDADGARAMAKEVGCTPPPGDASRWLGEPAVAEARTAYESAEKAQGPGERSAGWRRAAMLYSAWLEASPDAEEAPEPAFNGAYAYKQLGEYDKAIAMYQRFIARYGDSKLLERLQKGDPHAKPPMEPRPQRYEQRVKYLKDAYQQLSAAYVQFFDYGRAAQQYDDTSRMAAFEPAVRRSAARNALQLYATLGDQPRARGVRERWLALHPTAEEKSEADFALARLALGQWNDHGRDEGPNRAARLRAMDALRQYFDAHRTERAASRLLLIAAYKMTVACHAGRDPQLRDWSLKAVAAYESFRATDRESRRVARSPEAALAAEAEFRLIDSDLQRDPGWVSAHATYAAKARRVDSYSRRLDHLVDTYASPEWTVAARARQASLYYTLMTAGPSTEELARVTRLTVQRYVQAVHLSRSLDVYHPATDEAFRRLAALTQTLGNDRMRSLASLIDGFAYTDDMFLRAVPGLRGDPRGGEAPLPLPMFVSR